MAERGRASGKAARGRTAPSERFDGLADQIRTSGPAPSRLAASPLAHSIGFLLRLANGVSQGELSANLDTVGIRQSLYSVLLIINDNPGLNQQEVGQTLSIQQPNLVALVNELVTEGLVVREVNAEDRRSYCLSLTAKGRARLAEANTLHEAFEQRLAKAVSPLTPEQFRAALRGILEM